MWPFPLSAPVLSWCYSPIVTPTVWRHLVTLAAERLNGDGWKVEATRQDPESPWHVAARRGQKWCVVQLLEPASAASTRQARRRDLGQSVRLTPRHGTMQQWAAHIRPGGRVVFGAETLNGLAWMGLSDEGDLPARLGLPSDPKPAA